MLARYNDGDHISDYQDHSDLSALLERFDLLVSDGPSKIGAGIERFERRLNRGDGWSSPGFWVIRVDNTPTDFSYVQAVAGRPKSDAEEFSVACHNAVSRDLLAMKQRQFDHFAGPDGLIACDITGNLVGYTEAQLSHAHPPFGVIVKEFRKLKGWDGEVPPASSRHPPMLRSQRISQMMRWRESFSTSIMAWLFSGSLVKTVHQSARHRSRS